MSSASPTPLRGRYLVRDTKALVYLTLVDAVVALAPRRRVRPAPATPRRILVGVGGNIGDAIIATTALRALRRAFPDATIGVAASAAGLEVLRNHPDVSATHAVSHWRTDRDRSSLPTRLWRWIMRQASMRREIAAADYDVSVDLYPYYPNMAVLFWRAGIPRRIAYVSGGGKPLMTDAVEWVFARDHVAGYHGKLLERLGARLDPAEGYALAPIPPHAAQVAERLTDGISGPFAVLHPGTSDVVKAWPTDRWLELARQLDRGGHALVVTGRGPAEQHVARAIQQAVPSARNLVDKTTLDELRAVISRSAFLVAVDSAAGHFAAAEGIPVVSIMSGIAEVEHWRPLSTSARIATTAVACAPCFRARGCAHMTCVRGTSVSDVLALTPVSRPALR